MINTINLPPFKKMCITIGNLPTSFMESMSYYEALCWLYDYFEKTLLPAINTNSEAITELQNAFITLKSYVDNYFESLDVQTEINNKLDEMAESGDLAAIIGQYVNPIFDAYTDEVDGKIETQNNSIASLGDRIDAQDDEIADFESGVNANINNLNTLISAVTSGSPLVASSTAGMTDTTKIYVNTSDGYWYYYTNGAWTQGGVYQSTSDSLAVDELEKMTIYNRDVSFTTTSSTTLNVDYVCDIPANCTLNFNLKSYLGDNYRRYQVYLYRSDNTTQRVTMIGGIGYLTGYGVYTYTPTENFVKIRFIFEVTAAESGKTGIFNFNIDGVMSSQIKTLLPLNNIIDKEIYVTTYHPTRITTLTSDGINYVKNFHAGDIIEFNVDSYTGTHFDYYQVFLYRSDNTTVQLSYNNSLHIPQNAIVTYKLSEDFVKIRFYYTLSQNESGALLTFALREYGDIKTDVYNLMQGIVNSKLYGKKIGYLGDSFTGLSINYTQFIQNRSGSISYNYGVGGSRIYNANTYQDGGVTVTKQPFWKRVSAMDSSLDMICVFGGINDALVSSIYSTNLGTINDATVTQTDIDNGTYPSTFCSAFKTTLELIMSKYVGKKILVIIPPKVLNASYNPTMVAYNGIEAIIEKEIKIAKMYSIPVCNLYDNCIEMNNYITNVQTYRQATNDIHPNGNGEEAMSVYIENSLLDII